MEHAKKIVLIPHESVNTVHQQYRRAVPHAHHHSQEGIDTVNTVQTPGTPLSRLDASMKEILHSPNFIDEREKWKMYNQVLQRCLHFIEDLRNNVDEDRRADSDNKKKNNNSAEDNVKSLTDDGDDDIIASIPQKYRAKAKLLLGRLRNAGSPSISWSKQGVTCIGGAVVQDANIVHLINDAMREGKTARPAGSRQFVRFLRTAGIPREFFGNQRLWREGSNTGSPSNQTQRRVTIVPRPIESTKSSSTEEEEFGEALQQVFRESGEEEELVGKKYTRSVSASTANNTEKKE